jgi:hypothetical protein
VDGLLSGKQIINFNFYLINLILNLTATTKPESKLVQQRWKLRRRIFIKQ